MANKDICEVYCFDAQKVSGIQDHLTRLDIAALVTVYKILADENRLRIILALQQTDELCVCDVANIIGATVATASHHLRTLREKGLVTADKRGKMNFYALAADYAELVTVLTAQIRKQVI